MPLCELFHPGWFGIYGFLNRSAMTKHAVRSMFVIYQGTKSKVDTLEEENKKKQDSTDHSICMGFSYFFLKSNINGSMKRKTWITTKSSTWQLCNTHRDTRCLNSIWTRGSKLYHTYRMIWITDKSTAINLNKTVLRKAYPIINHQYVNICVK